jgi:hypothetical protein
MSYYLINLEKKYECETEHIIIDNKMDIDEDSSRFLIYYLEDEIPKEIYLKLPKIRLINDWSNYKYNQLKIRITPKYEKTDRIIEIINALEEKIKTSKQFNKKKKLEFVSILTKDKCYHLKTFFQENKTKISSDVKGKNIKITDFKNNGEIQMVLKLNHIWQKNDKFGLSSQLYQIKYFAPPDEQNINFIDKEDIPMRYFTPITEVTSALPPQTFNPIIQPTQPTVSKASKPMLMINSQMLQSVKLKPIEKN